MHYLCHELDCEGSGCYAESGDSKTETCLNKMPEGGELVICPACGFCYDANEEDTCPICNPYPLENYFGRKAWE